MSGSSSTNSLPLPLIVGGSVLLFRSHFYRHIRKLILPISCVALYYRLKNLSNADQSILTMISQFLQQHQGQISIISGDVLGVYLIYRVSKLVANVWSYDPQSFFNLITDTVFGLIKTLPIVKSKLDHERESVDKLVDEEMKSKVIKMGPKYASLPHDGKSAEEILGFLKSLVRTEDLVWENGKVSGAVYHGGREHQELLNAAFGLYSLANPLHPDMWPSSTKLESEIISMTANLMTTTLKTICG
jgi:hypothetical protein